MTKKSTKGEKKVQEAYIFKMHNGWMVRGNGQSNYDWDSGRESDGYVFKTFDEMVDWLREQMNEGK